MHLRLRAYTDHEGAELPEPLPHPASHPPSTSTIHGSLLRHAWYSALSNIYHLKRPGVAA